MEGWNRRNGDRFGRSLYIGWTVRRPALPTKVKAKIKLYLCISGPLKEEAKQYWDLSHIPLTDFKSKTALQLTTEVRADNSYTTRSSEFRKSSFKVSGRRDASFRSDASSRRLALTQLEDYESIEQVLVRSEVHEIVHLKL